MKCPTREYLTLIIAAASIAIGIEPLIWLIKAQSSPAQSQLALFRLAVVLLALWSSLRSPRIRTAAPGVDLGVIVLCAGLAARIMGLALGINHIGALALVCDLYAVCWILDLPGRKRSLSPLVLALASLLCLPVDRPLYRLLGFPLSWVWQQLGGGSAVAPETLVDAFIQIAFLVLVAVAFWHKPRLISWCVKRKVMGSVAVTASLGLVLVYWLSPPPVDRGARVAPPRLPAYVGGHPVEPLELSRGEQEFFARVGGNAAKGRYGELSLLIIESDSPLRHLHSPTWCLAGLGHAVAFLRYEQEPFATAVYQGTGPGGGAYLVESSFFSSKGHVVAEVSEAIWLWLFDRSLVWRSVQRFRPLDTPRSVRLAAAEQILQSSPAP